MANHPYNDHREQQVAHRRVDTILKGSPSGSTKHMSGPAFSKITSKSAASRDDEVRGAKSAKRYARGGKVKGKGSTNIAIIVGKGGAPGAEPPTAGPMPAGPPAMPPPPMGGPPGGPPGMPPGMPMRARGGKVTAGAESGVGRLQKARR